MRLRTKKLLKRTLITICLVVLLAAGYVGNVARQALGIGASFKAKVYASAVFISGMDPQKVENEEFAAESEIDKKLNPHLAIEIDREDKSVTVTALGLVARRAIYREGLGCTLLAGCSEDDIRAQSFDPPPLLPENPEEHLWPMGDLIPEEAWPEEVDAQALTAALDVAFSEPKPSRPRRTRAVIVLYKGRIVAERYAEGITEKTPLIGWSMTKSVTNALVGILVGQGRLSLDEPVSVPEWSHPDDPRAAITLDQLMRMSSGLAFGEDYGGPLADPARMIFESPNAAAYAAMKPLEVDPDTKFYYSSGTSNIVSRIVRDTFEGNRADYFAFPRRALFNRIGMRSAVIEPDASGTFVGSSLMLATARDWARFGLLYLRDGVWEGERILPEGWITYSATPTPTSHNGRYGAHFWLNAGEPGNEKNRRYPKWPADLFSANGYQGQTVKVIPSRQLVIVRLGMTKTGSTGIGSLVTGVLKAVRG